MHCIFSGDVTISDPLTLTVDSDLNGESPQFTLTCVSTGGPATTVTWTRDSQTVSGERMTVLNDPVTAQYTHTLTVTGRLGGLYQCNVSNNKPSSDTAQLTVGGNERSVTVFMHSSSGPLVHNYMQQQVVCHINAFVIIFSSLSTSPRPSL